jgi:ribonucleases P/MRP protein subunit RPP40
MPRVRQPKRLETLALKKSSEWLCLMGERLIPRVVRESKIDNKVAVERLQTVIEVAHDLFERYVPFYLYKPLSDEVIRGISRMIEKCKDAIEFKANMAKFLAQVNVALSLAQALISVKLRIVDFDEMPKMIRSAFYSQLTKMPGIEWLSLGSVSGGWKTMDMEYLLVDGLSNMTHLMHLCLNYDCTDNVLKTLVKTCPRLMSLDITNSKNINNASVDILVDLKNLRSIQLYRTSVSMEGFINILLHLPDLRDIGRYDELGRCFEYIDDYYPTYGNFRLESFVSVQATTKQIQILCEKCPNIEAISLFHNVLLLDLMAVIGLNRLAKLKLLSCDFFADQIRDVLEVKGCNLTMLSLEHVEQIDMNALVYISQFCPDLKTLVLTNCNLILSTSIRRWKLPPFMNLQNLTLIGECSPQHLEFILCNAHKLKFIHFGMQIVTNDELFEKVFLSNELNQLEEIRILHSDFLTIKTAYALVNNCVNLQKLFEIECWLNVTPWEFEELKRYVKEKNFDVDLTSFRRFVTA